ncbi:MAG: YIP1 family protein [Pseudorhodobacter sp.]|nr:YIP1 family protein [Pseudorhodobacter sp.]
MSVTADIVQSWRHPAVVVRRLLAQRSEPFAFSLLVTGLILLFVSLAPFLAREAQLHPEQPLTQRLLAAALGMAATVPFWYVLAALGHLVARVFGGKGSFHGGRIALFWALVAASPALLTYGLVRGIRDTGGASDGIGLLAGVAFVTLWVVMLIEVERE